MGIYSSFYIKLKCGIKAWGFGFAFGCTVLGFRRWESWSKWEFHKNMDSLVTCPWLHKDPTIKASLLMYLRVKDSQHITWNCT